MAAGGSLIDLGELSKPATILVEKVCNAVGVIYEPTRLKRLSAAKAEVAQLEARTRLEVTDIEIKGLERLAHHAERTYRNIESITAKAATGLSASAAVENLSEDWLAYFFKQCDIVSDEQIQTLWARVLTGEANVSGSFSRRTLSFLASIEKRDAELFTALCQFVWKIEGAEFPVPLVLHERGDLYSRFGINFSSLRHLDSIGLVSYLGDGVIVRDRDQSQISVNYFGRELILEYGSSWYSRSLELGQVILSAIGAELLPVCGAKPNEEFYEVLPSEWMENGFTLYSRWPREAEAET